MLEIIDGKDLLNERTKTELRYLKKACLQGMIVNLFSFYLNTLPYTETNPESWRLACQTIVGNKENSGKRSIAASFATSSTESAPAAPEKPQIELEFIGPKPGADGKYPVEIATAVSGQKLLRSIMSDNNIELYAALSQTSFFYSTHADGNGDVSVQLIDSEIIDGKDLLNERTKTELRYLKKACLQGMIVNLFSFYLNTLPYTETIIDGKDLLNERTKTELRYLKKACLQGMIVNLFSFYLNTLPYTETNPESWRLACQTIVGNKENSGKGLVNTYDKDENKEGDRMRQKLIGNG
ncbi:unnamed protein product [Ilex paraguariensis]|uniref:Uncharacterized protein n=1 Tax=Ilex paraguariensis TaxID=185542 RepID=A0ABC8UBQ7_9AQUA